MMHEKYVGHESQICGVEEHRLVGGKGDGMRLLLVRNGKGLEFTIAVDRCADIYRLTCKGDNFGYFSPTGYVSPAFYDKTGTEFLKNFTAGFMSTCGLYSAGAPCVDMGEEASMHGNIGNEPVEYICWENKDDEIVIKAAINDSSLFGRKLKMNRIIRCSKKENLLVIEDEVKNNGATISPLMILYHINIGYPLLSEKATLSIPSGKVVARDDHAKSGISEWDKMVPPTAGFEEQVYFHYFDNAGRAEIYNEDIRKGLSIEFDKNILDHFVEWKMMGEIDYVLGLEPGNCHSAGRDKMRSDGTLKFIEPYETKKFAVKFNIFDR